MRKDAFYFTHDSNAKDDPKCIQLIESLNPEGYGIFWILIETLRDQPNYRFPIKLIPSIARRYNTTYEKVRAVVYSFDLFIIDNDEVFYSESLIERMKPLEIHREKSRLGGLKSAEIRRKQLEIQGGLQGGLNGTSSSKVKESKVKDIYISPPIFKKTELDSSVQILKTEIVSPLKNHELFYKKEKDKLSSDSDHSANYILLIDFLYGKNETKEPLNRCLAIKKQISFDNFVELMKVKPKDVKIGQILLKMENDPKYTKNKASLYLTLKNWLTNRFVQK